MNKADQLARAFEVASLLARQNTAERAKSQYPMSGPWTLEQARWQLGDASPETRDFWKRTVAEMEAIEAAMAQQPPRDASSQDSKK